MRSLDIKRATYVIEFLGTWPLRYAVNIGLTIFLICLIAAIIPRLGRAAGSLPASKPPVATNVIALAQRVADAHLFGQEPGRVSGTAAAVPAAAIKVEGLLYSDDPKSALAILEVNGTSGSFRVGDVLADGEKLTAIAPMAVQLTQGMTQRVVEMPTQFGDPGDGMALTGVTGSGPIPLPGFASSTGAPAYQSTLSTVSLPVDADPLEQLRSLREQLIAPSPEHAPAPAKHPKRP